MQWHSIRTKVVGALLLCLVVGMAGILVLMRYCFEHNARVLATESVTGAQKLFGILESREISKMTTAGDILLTNAQFRDALAAKDRDRLLAIAQPLMPELKQQGITNWIFHTVEPEQTVLLRVHNPGVSGDHLNRFMTKEVARTHAVVSGSELARAGFALRTIRPVYDAKGAVAGYVEFGEELGSFARTMKEQTGNDYALLLNKKFVDRKNWADTSAALHRRDNWDDNAAYVLNDKTTASDDIMQFQGDLESIPAEGEVLERFQRDDSVLVRGLFPIHDAAGNAVGAIFVVRDITDFYVSVRQTQLVLMAVTVVVLALGAIVVVVLLNRLVFQRLRDIIQVATRVVGGAYHTAIQVSGNDEVSQFEQLFEQFRHVFVDVLSQVPQHHERELQER